MIKTLKMRLFAGYFLSGATSNKIITVEPPWMDLINVVKTKNRLEIIRKKLVEKNISEKQRCSTTGSKSLIEHRMVKKRKILSCFCGLFSMRILTTMMIWSKSVFFNHLQQPFLGYRLFDALTNALCGCITIWKAFVFSMSHKNPLFTIECTFNDFLV